ncbi:MAG: hypothetical protein ACNA7W_06690 [Pseudomonadales bacterium]
MQTSGNPVTDIQRSIEALEREYQQRRNGCNQGQRSLPASVSTAYRLMIAREMDKLARLRQLGANTQHPD